MKNGRKIFQQVRVDGNDNIIESITMYVSRTTETFGMYRKSDGLDWLISMTGNEIKLLIILSDVSDSQDGSVSLSPVKRQNICSMLGIGTRQLAQLIASLEKRDALFRINYHDFIINPATFFRCTTNELKKRIIDYYEVKKKLGIESNFENE